MKEFIIKKCQKCNAVVRVLKDCSNPSCGIYCCSSPMIDLKPNSMDASFEKHLPTYEKVGESIVVNVSHVMESDHFIEWISFVTPEKEVLVSFKPGETPTATFTYVPNSILYAYCNKHGVWMQEVK